jgi:hypothetical protein
MNTVNEYMIHETPIRKGNSLNTMKKESITEEKLMKNYDIFIKEIKTELSFLKIPIDLCLSDEIYAKELKCAFCENVAIECKMCIECDSLICYQCQIFISSEKNNNKLVNCINCKNKLNLKNFSLIKSKILENLILSCPSNFDYEKNEKKKIRLCDDIIVFRDILLHLVNCRHYEKLFECRNCKFTSKLTNVKYHLINKECSTYLSYLNQEQNSLNKNKNFNQENNNNTEELTFNSTSPKKLNFDYDNFKGSNSNINDKEKDKDNNVSLDKFLNKIESDFYDRIFKLENSFEKIKDKYESKNL